MRTFHVLLLFNFYVLQGMRSNLCDCAGYVEVVAFFFVLCLFVQLYRCYYFGGVRKGFI